MMTMSFYAVDANKEICKLCSSIAWRGKTDDWGGGGGNGHAEIEMNIMTMKTNEKRISNFNEKNEPGNSIKD